MARVYLASGPASPGRPVVAAALAAAGHSVFDRHAYRPRSALPPELALRPEGSPPSWEREERDLALLAGRLGALEHADAVVLVLPCDRGSLWDLGLALGWGAVVIAWIEQADLVPDLELAYVDTVCETLDGVIAALAEEDPCH